MSRKKEALLLLDTETVGDTKESYVFDFAYAIVDTQGNLIESFNYVVKETYEMDMMKTSLFTKEKYKKYKELVEKGEVKVLNFEHIMLLVDKAMTKHNVKTIGAYNYHFDKDKLDFTAKLVGMPMEFDIWNNKQELCVWSMACQTIATTRKYGKMMVEKGLVTYSGNYKTNLESVLLFLNGGTPVEQTHTALSDILQTVEVYKQCKKRGVKLEKIMRNPWKHANNEIKRKLRA